MIDRAMKEALEADGEKLRHLTGQDHGPAWFDTCDNCGGEGGFEESWTTRGPPWGDGADDGRWVECPTCHGSGWIVVDETPQLNMDEAFEP